MTEATRIKEAKHPNKAGEQGSDAKKNIRKRKQFTLYALDIRQKKYDNMDSILKQNHLKRQ